MFFISHRGNIDGVSEYENSPFYILQAIDKDFDVEIDLRVDNNKWYLGHDSCAYPINESFLLDNKNRLWCHAKNITALTLLLKLDMTCFWHQNDYYTLTSNNYIWTYPMQDLQEYSICLDQQPWSKNKLYHSCAGICSDYIQSYRDYLL